MADQQQSIGGIIYLALGICTAIIGHAIHGSIFWAIMDLLFMPLAWLKWLLCHEVNISIIKEAFSFFMQ